MRFLNYVSYIILVMGIGAVLLSVLPFIFAYPYSEMGDHSGPGNSWELIVMLAYEKQVFHAIVGLILIATSLIALRKKSPRVN